LYTIPVPREKAHQKTRDRLGEAIYLLLYFTGACDWKTGKICTTYEKITAESGFPERTIKRWMVALREAGEIAARRIPNGFVVTLLDYDAIARTRRVAKDRPKAVDPPRSDRPEVAHPMPTEVPEMACLSTISGLSDRPDVACRSTRNGLCNIKQILSQNHVQSTSQKDSSIDAQGDQNPPPEPPKALYRPAPGPEEARRMLDGLGEQELSDLRTRAMEELENDPVPFFRKFVRRNTLGELEPNPQWEPYVIEIRMAEILTRGVRSSAPLS
jgi:hypothetical protein